MKMFHVEQFRRTRYTHRRDMFPAFKTTLLYAALLLASLCAPLRAELLENELLVSGPQVEIEYPYGRHYHPGAVLALYGQIRVPGESSGFSGGITVTEGDPAYGTRYEENEIEFPGGAARNFALPIRAPAGGAALSFSVWRKGSAAGRREEIFRASLAGVFKVLPRQDRLA